MFDTLSRSWEITKMSFSVIHKDKELLLFPILATIFSILFLLAILFPTLIASYLSHTLNTSDVFIYLILFLVYLGLAFIGTFFNVCVVYTAKTRFAGGDATFMESIRFGFSRMRVILLWSILSAVVGVLLAILDRMLRDKNGKQNFLGALIVRALGGAWGIVTIFVVPAMVYNNLTPFDAIKRSVATLRKTWGESLVRHFGLGAVQTMVVVLGLLVFGTGFFFTIAVSPYLSLTFLCLGVLYLLSVFVLFSIANTIYNTALYVYADTGKVPSGFDKEHLGSAFKKNL